MEKVSSNDKIRVLQIGMHDQIGGIENILMNYFRRINKNKFQFDFIIPYPSGGYFDEEIKEKGGNVYYFSFKNDKNIFKFIKQLNSFFKENHYDIVHCSDSALGFIYMFIAKKNGVKIRIAHSHSSNVEKGIKGFIKKILFKIYILFSNKNIACSKKAGDFMFKKKKYEIISNSIDYSKFCFNLQNRIEIRNSLNLNKNDILIGHVGRYSVEKNQVMLLKLMKKLPPNYKLILIGEGPDKEIYKDYIKDNFLQDKVILKEPVKDVYKYYNSFDVFCLPSLFEGLPIVGVEAQVNGLKCLFSDEVTTECICNPNSKFLSLVNEEEWIEEILNVSERTNDIDNKFNITRAVDYLEKIYISYLEEK